MLSAFLLNSAIGFISLLLITYATGNLVFHKNVKVNYTRKINHFALFLIPIFLNKYIPHGGSIEFAILSALMTIGTLFIFIHPVRSRVPIINRMFISFDRPEDRPYTLNWLITQTIAGYLVVLSFVILFIEAGYKELILIPILINAIGDGLAEPVGIRFGKHTYKTKALFSNREYVRTLEGSSCVFISSIAILFLFQSSFTQPEFIWALLVLPLAMTIAEALSPHTWDTPFLFLTGFSVLYLIKWLPY